MLLLASSGDQGQIYRPANGKVTNTVRRAEDIGGQELSYAMVKAIASGNPAGPGCSPWLRPTPSCNGLIF